MISSMRGRNPSPNRENQGIRTSKTVNGGQILAEKTVVMTFIRYSEKCEKTF